MIILTGVSIALSNLMTNFGLPNIPYSFYVVAKSSKPVFIVLIGLLTLKGRYNLKKLVVCLIITAAVSVYTLSEVHDSKKKGSSDKFIQGTLCIVFFNIILVSKDVF